MQKVSLNRARSAAQMFRLGLRARLTRRHGATAPLSGGCGSEGKGGHS